MPKPTSYILSDHHNDYIASLIASGHYKSATEVMTDALRVHEVQTRQRKAFLDAVDAGMNSPTRPLDFDSFLDELDQKYAALESE